MTVTLRNARPCARLAGVALLVALLGPAPGRAATPDYPSFAPGLWELATTRDIDGNRATRKTTTCGNPTDGMRAIFAPNAGGAACRTSVPSRQGNRYSISSDCGERGSSRIEVTVHGDDRFIQVIDTRIGTARIHETIEARRIGACAK